MIPDFFRKRWFAFNPTADTVVALVTALVMIGGGYYLLVHLPEGPVQLIYTLVFESLLVIFPVLWLCYHKKMSLRELGITRERLLPSLAVSLALTLLFVWVVLRQYSSYGDGLIPHFLYNALILWEPFFVFCWLQLRFDKAFGIIPGILLAGVCFGAYHLGTYPFPMVLTLVAFGIFFAAIFRMSENLLIVWPLTWSTASAQGTLKGGFLFGWDDVLWGALILAVQLAVIVYIWKKFGNVAEKSL